MTILEESPFGAFAFGRHKPGIEPGSWGPEVLQHSPVSDRREAPF